MPPIWGAAGGGAGTTIDWVGLSSTVAVAGMSLNGLSNPTYRPKPVM